MYHGISLPIPLFLPHPGRFFPFRLDFLCFRFFLHHNPVFLIHIQKHIQFSQPCHFLSQFFFLRE